MSLHFNHITRTFSFLTVTLLLFLLSLFLSDINCVKAEGESVQELDPNNYDSVVGHEKSVFIKFYAPWCGHCKRLAPIFKKVGDQFSNRDDVIIAQVDASKHRNFLKRYNIRGFPTLLFFPPRSSSSFALFKGSRTEEKMNEFIEQQLDIVQKDEFVGETVSITDSASDPPIFSILVLLISVICAVFEIVVSCLDDEADRSPSPASKRSHHLLHNQRGLGIGNEGYATGPRRYLWSVGSAAVHLVGGYQSLTAELTALKALYLVTLVLSIAMQLVRLWVPYFHAPLNKKHAPEDVETGIGGREEKNSTAFDDHRYDNIHENDSNNNNNNNNENIDEDLDYDLSLFEPRPGVPTPRISDAVRFGLLSTNTFILVLSLVF